MKPLKLNLKNKTLDAYQKELEINDIIDFYKEQLKELFLIRNPQFRFNSNYQNALDKYLKNHFGDKPTAEKGEWFYFPWNKTLVHYLEEKLHFELRTARNKNLITAEEQEKFYSLKVGIAGLSVGSHAALTIAMMGGAKIMKLADPDIISGSNLNRIRYDFTKIGQNKAEATAECIYQINPYSELYVYNSGLNDENITEFLLGPPKSDLLIEETDNLEMKIKLRIFAKKYKIPIIMATDNGDNVIVDIERYDLNPHLKLFNGFIGDITLEDFKKIPPQDIPKIATKIAGEKFIVPKMLESLKEVGKTLYSWPQLGDAATLSGVVLAYLTKKIALGEKTKNGKFEVNLDNIFKYD